MIWAATLRRSLYLGGGVAGAALGLGGVFSRDGGDVESLIGISVFEKDQPNGQRKEDHHARKNQRFKAQISVNSKANQQQTGNERADETDDDTRHPGGEIGAKHIHCGGMSTTAQ